MTTETEAPTAPLVKILHRYTSAVLAQGATTMDALVTAVKEGAYLKGAVLEGAVLEGAYLKGADLKGADLEGAYLEGAYLEGAYLEGAYLEGAYLEGADLTGADLTGAYLEGAYLKGADLTGADLKGADLTGADLKGADLRGADLKGADLKGADQKGADLKGADLTGADLKGANLTGANLTGAYLTGALGFSGDVPADPVVPYVRVVTKDRAARALRYRERHPEVPVVEDLDQKILSAVESGAGRLDMSRWHTCDTTHCRAGWAVALAGPPGYELESKVGPAQAGRLIYLVSAGRSPYFFGSTERAMEDIRRCAAETAAHA